MSKKTFIAISVSHHGFVEIAQVDKNTGVVNKYSLKKIKYNTWSREIEDYMEFENAIKELFLDIHINPKGVNALLNLPHIYFGFIKLPNGLNTNEITTALTSEVENNYIFRKSVPKISWCEVESNVSEKTFAVTAIQEDVVNQITEIFENIGCKLYVIETMYPSFIRALLYSEIFQEDIKNNYSWCVILISPNSFTLFLLKGKKFVNCIETPIPISSYDDNEVYDTLSDSINSTISSFQLNSVVVISEIDNVSAEILANKLNFEGTIQYMEKNKYTTEPFVNISQQVIPELALKISLELIGISIYPFYDSYKFNLAINTSTEAIYPIIFMGKSYELTDKLIQTFIISILFFLLLIYVGLSFTINQARSHLEAMIGKLDKEAQDYQKVIDESSSKPTTLDLSSIKKNIAESNKKQMLYYDAISVDMPKDLWLTTYYTDEDGAIFIKGESISTESVYNFLKSLKSMIVNSDIALSKLQYKDADNLDSVYRDEKNTTYEFELTNAKADELVAKLTGKPLPVSILNSVADKDKAENVPNESQKGEVSQQDGTASPVNAKEEKNQVVPEVTPIDPPKGSLTEIK